MGNRKAVIGNTAKMQMQIKEALEQERKAKALQQDHAKKNVPGKKHVKLSRLVVEANAFVIFTTLLTVYALIGSDLRLGKTNKTADDFFDVVTVVCILVFSVEIILSSLGKEDYFGSFFFYLDAISTVTLMLDISTLEAYINEFAGDDGNLRS